MPNKPRIQKAEKGKYEGKAFLDYDEASDYLGIRRTTLYHHIIDLEVKTHKFYKDRRRYLAMVDVQRIERVMEEPWLVDSEKGRNESKNEDATPSVA